MENLEKDAVPYDLQQLIEELLAKQLVNDAYISALTAFLKMLIREVNPEMSEKYCKMFRELVTEKTEKLKVDNVFLNRTLNKRIRDELNGIPGIEFSE